MPVERGAKCRRLDRMNSCPPIIKPAATWRPPVTRPDDGQGAVVAERKAAEDRAAADVPGGMLNDDYTPMEFVVMVLQEYFNRRLGDGDADHAEDPSRGRGVCGVYSKDVAATKVELVIDSPHSTAAVHVKREHRPTRCNALWRPHDCARAGSQPAHGVRRGPAAAPRVHHRRAPAAGAAGQPVGRRSAARCSANIDDLRKSLLDFIKENTPTVGGTDEVDTQPTLGFQRVIQRAIMHVQSTGSGKKEVTGANVLVAIFGEKDSHAVYYLHQQGVTRLDVVNFIAHGIKKSDPPEPAKPGEGRGARTRARRKSETARARRSTSSRRTSTSWRKRRQDRSADRPRARGRARDPDPVPPAQEQPAAGRRGRRRQDGDRRGPGLAHHPERRARGPAPSPASTRSTWARCSPAPSTAATSSSA